MDDGSVRSSSEWSCRLIRWSCRSHPLVQEQDHIYISVAACASASSTCIGSHTYIAPWFDLALHCCPDYCTAAAIVARCITGSIITVHLVPPHLVRTDPPTSETCTWGTAALNCRPLLSGHMVPCNSLLIMCSSIVNGHCITPVTDGLGHGFVDLNDIVKTCEIVGEAQMEAVGRAGRERDAPETAITTNLLTTTTLCTSSGRG
jgi:hypothetical protein